MIKIDYHSASILSLETLRITSFMTSSSFVNVSAYFNQFSQTSFILLLFFCFNCQLRRRVLRHSTLIIHRTFVLASNGPVQTANGPSVHSQKYAEDNATCSDVKYVLHMLQSQSISICDVHDVNRLKFKVLCKNAGSIGVV